MSVASPPRPPAAPERPRTGLRHRLADRGIDRTLWLLLPAAVFIALLFLYPFAYGLGLSFQPTEGGNPFSNYSTFFSDACLSR